MGHRIAGTVVLIAALITGIASGATAQGASDPARWESGSRTKAYVGSMVGVGALVGLAASTTIDHLRDEPPQWDGAEGFGQRATSNFGRLVVQETVRHGLAAAFGRSTWYYPCSCTPTGERIGHAILEAFTDHDRSGVAMVSVSRIAGAYGGAYAQTFWRPDMSVGDAVISGSTSLVFGALGNLTREFLHWPR